jgi:LuxR family maltose regulon positive regulatory protein
MLPEEVIWVRPKLLVAQAWLLYRQWHLKAMDTVLGRTIAALEANEETFTSGEKRFLWGQIHTLRSATFNIIHNDFQGSLEAAEQALQYLPFTERGARSIALAFYALAQQAMGEKNTAARLLEEAIHDPSHLSPSHIQALLGLSFHQLIAGELSQMRQTTQNFLVFAAENKNANAIVAANWVSGLLNYELNDLDAARDHFLIVKHRRYSSNFAAAFNSMLGLVRINQVHGELDKAQVIIDDIRSETFRLNNPDHLPLLDSIQAYQWLLKGDLASALRWARSYHPDELHESFLHFELPSLTRARIIVSGGTKNELQVMHQELQDNLIAAEGRHITKRVIQILAHLALDHQRLGSLEAALETLEAAVLLAQPGGFMRSFVDAGISLVPLFQQLQKRNITPDYLSQILAAFDAVPKIETLIASSGMPASHESEILDLVTRREEEILRLMGDGLTNQEIANQLVISLYTVKRHATNIYHKLSVNNRRGAIRKARQLGIIPS